MSTFQLSSSTPPHLGQRFGNYLLISWLGRGGFASVYQGIHVYLETPAAIKILHTSLTGDDERRFHSEARFAARLVHPHIIRVLDFGIEGHQPYLLMDYAPHGSLQQRHPFGMPLAPVLVCEYAQQIASALQYLHQEGLIHRDVKPGNVLLGARDDLLLSDFGITIATHEQRMTDERIVLGTTAYMAPEQIHGEAFFASDQYALGVMVYEWLCGALPFQGTPLLVMQQHLHEQPPSLRTRNPAISPAVEEVVLRALAKNPRERFESVQDFADALDEACSNGSRFAISSPLPEKKPVGSRVVEAKTEEKKNIWIDMFNTFALSLLAGAILGILLRVLGVNSQALWLFVSLSMALIAFGGAAWWKSNTIFFLVCAITIGTALLGLIFQSLVFCAVAYFICLGISALVALTGMIHYRQ